VKTKNRKWQFAVVYKKIDFSEIFTEILCFKHKVKLDGAGVECHIPPKLIGFLTKENVMATLGTLLFTWRKGEQVGEDEFGNRYYKEKGKPTGVLGRERRWVLYKGKPEASKVPAAWHIWLHHTTNKLPVQQAVEKNKWEEEHLPNLTGTGYAYHPGGSALVEGKRQKSSADYEAWKPE
jgi:NADH:ubiquinone oxidoreductase subunit